MTRINPNSSIRSGYTFEDLHVLKYCVEWLLDPKAYTHIQIQNVPAEVEGKGFAIDDVTIKRSDGFTEYYQLKHRQHPDRDLWDFSELMKKGLPKWIKSYLDLYNSGPVVCAFVSNGIASEDLAIHLLNDRLDQQAIAESFPVLYSQLSTQFSEAELDEFFRGFKFKFDEPGISELESSLREVLYKQLKVTKAGVDSLLLHIIAQGRAMYPKLFTLEEIRGCLSWDNPRPLNQNFEIPEDFEFFDRAFHEKLLHELREVTGGIKVFTGKPGCGKSTYLSKLYATLKKGGIMTFRHHYHLNPKDASFAERLNTDRVKEALKAEFKKQKNSVLGNLGEVNTQYTPIKEFIDRIATYHRDNGTTFVIIIDGLDHVIREGKSRQALVDFLNDLLYPQAGFWLIFGTQEMATPCFPKIVEDYAPKAEWMQIKGLGPNQVAKIAKKSFPELAGKHKDYFKECADILFKRCAGNPLHLRYILTEVKNSGSNISSYDLERIAPYGGDISIYYTALWTSLSDLAKSFCYAITALDFKLHKEQLMSLGAELCRYPAEIPAAFKDIAHLIRIELSGIAVYHNSFQVFMGNQPELKEQQAALYLTLREWLKNPSQERLRWSEYAKIEFYLGNPDPLMALDKDWIISSYLDCRDEHQIQKLLDLACRAAFEYNQPEKIVYFSILSSYFSAREYNLSETLDPLWSTAFRAKSDLYVSYPDFTNLSHYQIKEILIHLKGQGLIEDIPDEAIDRMNLLFRDHSINNDNLVTNWIEVLVAFSKDGVGRIFNFLKQFRDSGESAKYLAFYVKQVLEVEGDNLNFVRSVLKLKLIASERKKIIGVLMQIDMRSGRYRWRDLIQKTMGSGSGLANYYTLFSGLGPVQPKALPLPDVFPDEYEYHGSAKGAESIALYEGIFDAAYFSVIAGEKRAVNKWLNKPSERWPVQLAKVVIRIAVTLAERFSDASRIKLSDIFLFFDDLRKLDFSHDFKIYELKRAIIPYVIDKAIWLVQLTNIRNHKNAELTKPEFDLLYHHHWYYRSRMFDLVKEDSILISEDALSSFLDQELNRLRNDLIHFGDKAKEMMDITLLYKDFQNGIHLPRLLRLTAENMLAYGYHKDMFMYNILHGLEILMENRSPNIGNYLNRIMPYVYHIERLTDGDETRHFISKFYALVANYDTQLLYNFYFHRLDTREYIDSDQLWGHVVPTLNLNDPVAVALANTAIDHSGYTALITDIEKPGVSNVVASIRSKFGALDYSVKEKESTSYAREDAKDSSHLQVKPGQLWCHLSVRKDRGDFTRYDDKGFLSRWVGYWLKRDGSDTKKILNEVKSVLADKPWDYGKEILEIMYPYALKSDKNLAFQLLCWQMICVGGWNSNYMTPMKDARPIWQQVVEAFPQRLDEFYTYTITHSGLRYGDDLDYSQPMPKSIQFFADAGQLDRAEQLMSHYLDGLSGLFPNISLPVLEFWNAPKSIQPIHLLLRRLEWMSPLVRCRAAEGIADLLILDQSAEIHEQFYKWLKSCTLESIACNGLMVILRSLRNRSSYTFKHLGQFRIGGLLTVRCMATDLLLQRIADLLGVQFYLDIPHIIQLSSEQPEIDMEHFKKLIGRNLTVSYLDFLDSLEEDSPFPVWQAWLCMYKERCDEMRLVYESEDERYENQGQSVMVGRNTIFAEILKSTFFVILDGLYDMGFIDYGTLFRLTLKNLPVDPSVWSISPGQQPVWWPVFEMPLLKSGDEYPEIEEPITESFSNTGDQTVLSMRATYFNGDDFYSAETYCSQEIIAFAYPTDNLPRIGADQIFRAVSNSGFYYPKINSPSNFGVLDNDIVFHGEQVCRGNIQPLSARLNIYTHHIWEHFRIFEAFKLLHPFLTEHLDMKVAKNSVDYSHEGQVIAKSADFMSGLRDTMNPHVRLIPYSSYLTINTVYLNDVLRAKGLAMAYVVKEEFMYKDKPYLDQWPKPHVRHRLIL